MGTRSAIATSDEEAAKLTPIAIERSDFRLEVASRETGRVSLATQVRVQKSRLA